MSLLGVHKEAALEVWTGLPGGGKSYQAAQLQVAWIEAGHPVVTNLKIQALPYSPLRDGLKFGSARGEYVLADDEQFSGVDPVLGEDGKPIVDQVLDSDGQPVYDKSGKPKQVRRVKLKLLRLVEEVQKRNPGKHVLVVIDEAHNYYPASNTMGGRTPDAIKVFLRQHRHMSCSILAVVQNHAMLDNNFLRLAQCFRHHKNLVKDSWLQVVLWWWGDNFHLAYSMANQGGKPFQREKFARKWFKIKKTKATFYSTIQMHASDLRGQMAVVRGKALRPLWLLLLCSFVYGSWRFSRILTGHDAKPARDQVQAMVGKPAVVREKLPVLAFELQGSDLLVDVQDGKQVRRVLVPYTDDLPFKLQDRGYLVVDADRGKGRPMKEVFSHAGR